MYYFPFLTFAFTDSTDAGRTDDEEDDDNYFNTEEEYCTSQNSFTHRFVNMMAVFLLKWQGMFHISDNALDALIKFLHNVFNEGKIMKSADSIIILSKLFPKSFLALKKSLKFNAINYMKFAVCSKCHSLYGNLHTEKCKHILYPANSSDTCCGNNLLKTIKKQNEVNLVPIKQYFYHPLKYSIATMMQRKDFVEAINHWRDRSEILPHEWMGDVYDGKVWQELKDSGYFDSPYSLAVSLNVDWFQPYSRVTDSVGVIYLSILNLARKCFAGWHNSWTKRTQAKYKFVSFSIS